MTTFFIYPYSQHSAGAIRLADALDGKRVKLTNSDYSYKPEHVLINWGHGNCPYPQALNPASALGAVINKKEFFQKLEGTGLVPKCAFTKTAAANLSFPVVCRTTVEGHDGQGIVIADNENQLITASLYTEYFDKTSEYRIHVGRDPSGEIVVIGRQKKSKTTEFTGDARIWTGAGTRLDWISTAPAPVITAAKAVFAKFSGLTFGAFDVAYDNSSEKAYVLEINSAPMMTDLTANAYAEFFRQYIPTAAATPAPVAAQETTTMPPHNTAAAAISGSDPLTSLVRAQLSAGHITTDQLMAAYTPPQPTQDELVQNYVQKLTAS